MDMYVGSKNEVIKARINKIFELKESIQFIINFQCVNRLKIIRDSIDDVTISDQIINNLNKALEKLIGVLETYEKLKQYQNRCNSGLSSKKDIKTKETLENCVDLFEDYILELEFPELTYREDFEKSVEDLKEFLSGESKTD